MLFDTLCRVVERYLPRERLPNEDIDIHAMVEDARIFELDVSTKNLDRKPHKDPQFIEDTFALPFRTTAIEDKISLTILQDIEENTFGMDKYRNFLHFMPVISKYYPPPEAEDYWDVKLNVDKRDCYNLVVGKIRRRWKGVFAEGHLERALFCTRDRMLMDSRDNIPDSDFEEEYAKHTLVLAEPGFEQVIYINSLTHFIVEETTIKKPGGKPPLYQIPRSVDRPKYLLVPVTEIRKKICISDKPPTPGEKRGPLTKPIHRRGHYRNFRSERFTEERRKVPLWIKAYWVGPTTGPGPKGPRGNKFYRVLLDK